MKRQILVAAVAALLSITTANAQGGGNFQRKTPEERVKAVHDKMDSAFHLDAAKQKQVDDIFLNYYKDSDKKMDEIRASGGDRDAMMAARKQATDDRDAKLKGILTDDQLKTWKDIEASMRPQRGNRGGGGGGK
jgi:periplasmic protein CpxP/Spy